MALRSRSTKIQAVVHVGSLSGVVSRHSQPQNQLINYNYELHGVALEVCRQIMTQTSRLTESQIKVILIFLYLMLLSFISVIILFFLPFVFMP